MSLLPTVEKKNEMLANICKDFLKIHIFVLGLIKSKALDFLKQKHAVHQKTHGLTVRCKVVSPNQ